MRTHGLRTPQSNHLSSYAHMLESRVGLNLLIHEYLHLTRNATHLARNLLLQLLRRNALCSGQAIPDSGLSFFSATAGGSPSLA